MARRALVLLNIINVLYAVLPVSTARSSTSRCTSNAHIPTGQPIPRGLHRRTIPTYTAVRPPTLWSETRLTLGRFYTQAYLHPRLPVHPEPPPGEQRHCAPVRRVRISLAAVLHASQHTLPPSVALFAEPVHVNGGEELWMMDVDGEADRAVAESGETAEVGEHGEFEEGGSGGSRGLVDHRGMPAGEQSLA